MNKQFSSLTIFGGSFDPIHWGHIRVVDTILRKIPDTQIKLLPAGNPWQKNIKTRKVDRVQMLKLAIPYLTAPYRPGQVEIDLREIEQDSSNYTYETVANIRDDLSANGHTNMIIFWVLGMDQFCNLNNWFHWRDLSHFVHLLVFPRKPFQLNDVHWWLHSANKSLFKHLNHLDEGLSLPSGGVFFISESDIPGGGFIESSSQFRQILGSENSQSINKKSAQTVDMVPPLVWQYITEHRLYQD